jgi:hypothetical protein
MVLPRHLPLIEIPSRETLPEGSDDNTIAIVFESEKQLICKRKSLIKACPGGDNVDEQLLFRLEVSNAVSRPAIFEDCFGPGY